MKGTLSSLQPHRFVPTALLQRWFLRRCPMRWCLQPQSCGGSIGPSLPLPVNSCLPLNLSSNTHKPPWRLGLRVTPPSTADLPFLRPHSCCWHSCARLTAGLSEGQAARKRDSGASCSLALSGAVSSFLKICFQPEPFPFSLQNCLSCHTVVVAMNSCS